MSAGYTSQPLVVRPWCNHAATTVGYINDKGRFTPLADCSIGPDFAVNYESFARLLASAPDLLAERDKFKALNAELAAALEDLTAIIENAGLLNLMNGVQLGQTSWYVKASDRLECARAALAKNKETTC